MSSRSSSNERAFLLQQQQTQSEVVRSHHHHHQHNQNRTWNETIGGVGEESILQNPNPQCFSQPAVREIHKNAWLKSSWASASGQVKKSQKYWIMFCVHDDVEAFVEFYTDSKMGSSHRPLVAHSLNKCLHVSPSILGQENEEYEFAITLPSTVIRLVAKNWDQMIEWVESLQGKLREMNIISPRNNLYSKLPETNKSQVCSTRDPNSPLPPPPYPSATSNAFLNGDTRTNLLLSEPRVLERPSSATETVLGLSHLVHKSASSENVYEPLFNPGSSNNNSQIGLPLSVLPKDDGPPILPRRPRHHQRRLNRMEQRSSSLSRLEEPDMTRSPGRPTNPSSQFQQSGEDMIRPFFTPTAQLQGTPMDAIIGVGVNGGEYRIRRDESQMQRFVLNSIPLKEQQVLRLKTEMNHPGGMRVVLRKKDCINTIALVDYLGAVWVAGWKQRQYPVLYYAFHVGDQLLKVAGITVHSSQEAQRAIRMVTASQVELIIRRLPLGSVFVIKGRREGEPLGLVAEGNTGEICEVLEGGLASKAGLPSQGRSLTDPRHWSNWYLTEINSRPLSLLSRDGEVKDRLNAVGREISILVQPTDFIKHLKSSLRQFKSYKDFCVG